MKKRVLSMLLASTMALSLLVGCGGKDTGGSSAGAGSFPNDTVKIIVPWGVGGGVDVMARKFAQVAEKYLGQPIIVENHTGAAGTIAMADTMDAKSDGYTMVVANGPLFSLTPNYMDTNYTLEDFTPLKGMRTVPLVLLVNPAKSGINTFEELVEYGKTNTIKYATSGGPGGDQYTMVTAACKAMGVKSEVVVYDGQGESINAIVGGHVDMAIATPPTYYEHERAGTIKAVASLTPESIDTEFGTVKSVKEMGTDVEFQGMDYFAVRSDVPEDVKAILLDAINKTYEDPEFVKYMEELQYPIWNADTQEIIDLIKQQTIDMEKYIQLIG